MSYDLRENIVTIYRYQSFLDTDGYGIAYEVEGALQQAELTQVITILEIVKQQLLSKFARLGRELETE